MTHASVPGLPFSRQGSWRTYTPADGLAALHVEHIAEDQEGCLWFATCSGGISRFDGEAFRTFTRADGLPSHHLLCLGFDWQGRLWLGGEGILCVYDGRVFQYQWLPELGSIRDLVEDADGTLWLATNHGVRCYIP